MVNSDNVSLAAMDTGGLLDLFTLQDGARSQQQQQQQNGGSGADATAAAAAAAAGSGVGKGGRGLAQVLEGRGDLEAAEQQYAGEFDLSTFRAKLRKA